VFRALCQLKGLGCDCDVYDSFIRQVCVQMLRRHQYLQSTESCGIGQRNERLLSLQGPLDTASTHLTLMDLRSLGIQQQQRICGAPDLRHTYPPSPHLMALLVLLRVALVPTASSGYRAPISCQELWVISIL